MKHYTFALRILMACLLPAFLAACSTDDNLPPSYTAANPASSGPALVAATGQDTCYNALGSQIDCAATGQDGELQKGAAIPDPRFTDNSDGTVTDNVTGLMWMKDANCYEAINNAYGAGQLYWQTGLDFARNVNASAYDMSTNCGLTASYTDWRVPNVREMQSLVDFRYSFPAISNANGSSKWSEGNLFTGLQIGAALPTIPGTDTHVYLTSTTYVHTIAPDPATPIKYWGFGTVSGEMTPIYKTNTSTNSLAVLLTRTASNSAPAPVPATGQTKCYDHVFASDIGSENACGGTTVNSVDTTAQDGFLQKGVAIPTPRFTDNANGTITDNLTGLVWMKEANCLGDLLSRLDTDDTDEGKVTWQHALDFIAGLNYGAHSCGNTDGYTDWRLPNYRELNSLINFGYSNPAISNRVGDAKWSEGDPFTGLELASYWSSTTLSLTNEYAWILDVTTGKSIPDFDWSTGSLGKSHSYYVWPVRGGN